MKDVPTLVLEAFQERKTAEKAAIELRRIRGYYYVYQVTHFWNKQLKKSIKITRILGSITPNGTYKPKRQITNTNTSHIYEYGHAELCLRLSQDIQNALTNTPMKNEILALSIIRAIDPGPIRLAQDAWEDTYLSTKLQANLTPKNVTATLSTLGNMVQENYELFAKLAPQEGMLFYDLTSILSYSKNLDLAEKGFNPEHETERQVNVAMAFSTSTWLPVAVDVFYGSIREVKVLKYFRERFPNKDLGFVIDRGFSSPYKLFRDLKKEDIRFIVPLKKNAKLLPLFPKMTGTFEYGKKRFVAFCVKPRRGYGFLYLFEDPELKAKDEKVLLGKVNKGKMTMDQYRKESHCAGVVGILSNVDAEPRRIYEQYKEREEIEQAFDYMKNDLEADRTYLGRDDAERGYFLVVFLAMRIYFKILKRLRERDLVGKVSVKEVLWALSKMRKVVEVGGTEYFGAFPKKTEEMLEIFSEVMT